MTIQRLTQVEPAVVNKMASVLTSQKPDVIQDRFGIGLNTWVKLREGRAIRHSVAVRLLQRLQRDQVI
ncbi:MAG: hypothetical protein RIS85_1865 [Pseudomonadota bacterium]